MAALSAKNRNCELWSQLEDAVERLCSW